MSLANLSEIDSNLTFVDQQVRRKLTFKMNIARVDNVDSNACRTCLAARKELLSLWKEVNIQGSSAYLKDLLVEFTSVEVRIIRLPAFRTLI